MVVSRFTVMAWLGRKPKHLTAGLGLVLMGVGYVVLPSVDRTRWPWGCRRLSLGLDPAPCFQSSAWGLTEQFEPPQGGRAMTHFTTFFQGTIFIVLSVACVFRGIVSTDFR